MFVCHIFGASDELSKDREAVPGIPPFAGGGEAASHLRVGFIFCQQDELLAQLGCHEVVVAKEADGPVTDEGV